MSSARGFLLRQALGALDALVLGSGTSLPALAQLPGQWSSCRAFAVPASPAKKGGRDKGPRRTGELSKTHATGCGLMKGQADPELRADSEYPEWLWKLADTPPTAKDLVTKYQAGGQGLTVDQLKRLWRLKNKERIREENLLRAK